MLKPARPFIEATAGNADEGGRWSLPSFYLLARAMVPWFAVAASLLCALGLYVGVSVAHAGPWQREASRIMFIHVPAAWTSLLIYLPLVACAVGGALYNVRLPVMVARAFAPTGAMFAFLALWSGSLWSRATLGVWWVWDLRPLSQLILLLLYLGFIWIQAAAADRAWGDKAGALLAVAGIADIPINITSVQWWPEVFHTASINLIAAPGTVPPTLLGIVAMAAGFCAYACTAALLRLRCLILERERFSDWVDVRETASP